MREALQELMKTQGLTQTEVARSLGLSSSALSQYLAGTYQGNVEKIDIAVKGFIERWEEKKRLGKIEIQFVPTTVARKVWEVARVCHNEGEIGVVTGPAGVGKTWALAEYARQYTDVIFIEADLGYTARSLFVEIAHRIGTITNGNIHDIFEDVIGRLQGSGRLIIIDEAEHLPYRALELLRRVYDKAGVGILLVGMPRLIENLRGKRGEYEQLYSRVGIYASLNKITIADAEEILSRFLPAANGLSRRFYDRCGGNTRVLTKLAKRALRIAQINDRDLDAEVVDAASKTLII